MKLYDFTLAHRRAEIKRHDAGQLRQRHPLAAGYRESPEREGVTSEVENLAASG